MIILSDEVLYNHPILKRPTFPDLVLINAFELLLSLRFRLLVFFLAMTLIVVLQIDTFVISSVYYDLDFAGKFFEIFEGMATKNDEEDAEHHRD